jgi:pilus assembly protein CpaE
VHLPSSRDVPLSVNRGEPIYLTHPVHPVSQAIGQLADRCTGTERVQTRRRGLFSRRPKAVR